jgi:thiamine biosynthesis protein ThiS
MKDATTETIQIVVNGQVLEVPGGRTLPELLVWLQIDPSRVAVELNRRIVSRDHWSMTKIDAGAALEIVQFVGGG